MLYSMADDQSKDLIEERPEEVAVEKSEVRKQVEKYIGCRFEVFMTDGRIVRGVMIATDKDANMIFNKADERWSQNLSRGSRYLGQAMISKKYVKSMHFMTGPKETEI